MTIPLDETKYPDPSYQSKAEEPARDVSDDCATAMGLMRKIPAETPPTSLNRQLQPLFEHLITVDFITAKSFIRRELRQYFKLQANEADDYVRRLTSMRKEQHTKARNKKERRDGDLPLITDRDINSPEVARAVSEIGVVSDEMLEIVMAVCISAKMRLSPPLWLLIVGAPSSFKTELVGLLGSLEDVLTLDTLTDNAFISGFLPEDGSEPQDLLPLLDGKCFIIKDLTTIFSLREDSVRKLLGDLTSIFDGKFEKFMATRGSVSYHSLFSMIGCITPAILNKHHNYVNQLGPRFFFLRVPELTEEKKRKGYEIAWKKGSREENINYARQIVSSYCAQLIKKINSVNPSDEVAAEVQQWLNKAADFVSKARGIAITTAASFENEKGEKVEYYEVKDWQVEEPWRALRQLLGYARVLAYVRGKNGPTLEECHSLRPLIVSTMQVDRAEIVKALINEGGLTRKDLADLTKKSTKTVGRTLKELEILGLTNAYKKETSASGKSPRFYFVSGEYTDLLEACAPTGEFMSQSNSTTSIDEEIDIADIPF